MKNVVVGHLSDNKVELLQKLKEWWTVDVDGDCITLDLCRNTEISIILLKRWIGDFKKEEYCQIYQQCFYLEELTRVGCRSVENKTMEEPMKQKLKIRNIISITVLNLIQLQNLDLSEYLLIDYPNLKDFRLLILQNIKRKRSKMYYLVIYFTG